jgi:RNA polymerase sigma factor (sigma-70 family)
MTHVLTEQTPDAVLWDLVCQGNQTAYAEVVRRYQALVSAVAYNACGDLAQSEDVAQEAFWAAWRQRHALARPERLRAWLCGIARNLGHAARRHSIRPAPLAEAADLPAGGPGPLEAAVSEEEQALVWQTLAQIPETYREPLILYYRQGQSVAEVSAALELSPDAVKQRLARGRGMLQERLAELVEGVLRRSRPGQHFTSAVVLGLAGGPSALAATGTAGSALKVAGLSGGLVGGFLGPLLGLLGGWLGTWVPAQLAPTRRERELFTRTGRRMLLVSVGFFLLLGVLIWALAGRAPVYVYLIGLVAWIVAFDLYVVVESINAARTQRRLAAEAGPHEPNDTPLRRGAERMARRIRGRVYRSRATLFGLPLLNVQVSDPDQWMQAGQVLTVRRMARGWIAIGDDARGLLLAVGGSARGFFAIGGRSVGVLSVGGVAVGLVAIGGAALGGLALGGLAVGGIAIGGLGIGWQAAGGGAVGWDVACGGGALARHAAYGGAAYARDYAVGGEVWAAHANDAAARAFFLDNWLKHGLDWYGAHLVLVPTVLVALCLLPLVVLPVLMYRRADRLPPTERD